MGGFINPATVLFVGLGLTFGVIGLLSTYLRTNLRWAYFPAAVLLVLGLVVVTPFGGAFAMAWPLLLIAGGAFLVLRHASRGKQLPAASAATTAPFVPPAASKTGAGVGMQPQAADAAAENVRRKNRRSCRLSAVRAFRARQRQQEPRGSCCRCRAFFGLVRNFPHSPVFSLGEFSQASATNVNRLKLCTKDELTYGYTSCIPNSGQW